MCAIAMEQEQELTIVQVAHRLGVSVDTVRRRIDAKLLKARREGKEWRISEGDLAEYIKSTYPSPGDTSKRDTDKHQIITLPQYGEELE